MRAFASLLLLVAFGHTAMAETALSAMRALPAGEADRLTRIEAQDGVPSPERWRFSVADPKAPNALRQYVVENGKAIAATNSATGESVDSKAVLRGDSIVLDSDRIAKIVLEHATNSGVQVYRLNYELRKQARGPVWAVTALDADSKPLGSVVVTATGGNIIAQEGFGGATPTNPPQQDAVATAPGEAAPATAPQQNTVAKAPGENTPPEVPEVFQKDEEFLASREARFIGPQQLPPVASPDRKLYVPDRYPYYGNFDDSDFDEEERAYFEEDDYYDDGAFVDRDRKLYQGKVVRRRDDGDRRPYVEIRPSEVARRATAPVRRIIRKILPF